MLDLDKLIEKKAKQYVAKDISNTIGEHVYLNHLKVVENEVDDTHSTLLLEYLYDNDVIAYLVRAIPNSYRIDFIVSPLVEDDQKVIAYIPEVADNGDVLPTKLDLQQDEEESRKADTPSDKKANNCDWEDLHDFLDLPGFSKAEKGLKKVLNNWLDYENNDRQ